MKKSAKLLSLFLVLALAVVGLVIGVSAADTAATNPLSDSYNGVTVDANLAAASDVIIYNNVSDFVKDKGDGVINLKDKEGNSITPNKNYAKGTFAFNFSGSNNQTNGLYAYLLNDVTFDVGANGTNFIYAKNFTLDCGDNTFKLTANGQKTLSIGSDSSHAQGVDFNVTNGTFHIENSGGSVQVLSARVGSTISFKNVKIIVKNHGNNGLIQDSGVSSISFENVEFDFSASSCKISSVVNRRGVTYQYILDPDTGTEITKCVVNNGFQDITSTHKTHAQFGADNIATVTFKNVSGTSTSTVRLFYFNYAGSHTHTVDKKDAQGNQVYSSGTTKATVSKTFTAYFEDDLTVNFEGTNTFTGAIIPVDYTGTVAGDAVKGGAAKYVNFDINYSEGTTFTNAEGFTKLNTVAKGFSPYTSPDKTYAHNVNFIGNNGEELGLAKLYKEDRSVYYGLGSAAYEITVSGETTIVYGDKIADTDLKNNGATIKLLKNVHLIASADVSLTGNFTLDLNGKTLTVERALVSTHALVSEANANTLIKNGKINVYDQRFFVCRNNSTAEFNNVDLYFENKTNTIINYNPILQEGGKLSFINSDIDSNVALNSGIIWLNPNTSGGAQDRNKFEFLFDGGSFKTPGTKKHAQGTLYINAIYLMPNNNVNYVDVSVNVTDLTTDSTVAPTKFFSFSGQLEDTCTYNVNVKDSLIRASQVYQARPSTVQNYPLKGDGKINLNFSNVTFNKYALEADTNVNTEGHLDVNFVTLDDNFKPTGAKQALIYSTTSLKEGPCYVGTPAMGAMNANLSLYSDFTLNLYIPTDSNITNIGVINHSDYHKLTSVPAAIYAIDEETGEKLVVKEGGKEYYVAQVTGISPTNAQDKVNLVVTYKNGTSTETVIAKYSVLNYAKDYLAGETTTEGEALIMDTLAYVKAATVAYNANLKEGETARDITAVNELLGDYATTVTVPENTATLGKNDYIESATFDIVNNVTLLKLKMKANATVTVAGVEGTVGDDGCVYVELRAFMLANEFAICADGNYVGTYSLASYYNSDEVQGASDAVKDLVKALYAYGVSARAYKVANA